MSFHDVTFPADIAYGSTGGPAYQTDVITTEAGLEKRNLQWQQARARYNVAHGVKTQAQLDVLIAFFRARKGRAYGFRFRDWADHTLDQQVIGTGNGSQTDFPIVRTYSSGGYTESRRITRPVLEGLVVTKNGVAVAEGAYAVEEYGIVSFNAAPAAGQVIRVSGEFDVPVRFDTDQLSARIDHYGIHSWLDIALVEVREV